MLEPTGIKEKSAIRAKVKHSAKECIFFFRRAESRTQDSFSEWSLPGTGIDTGSKLPS